MKKDRRPHLFLLMMLQGDKVPEDFKCNGCSMSPDGWFYWACRIHDWDAYKLRELWRKLLNMSPGDPAYKKLFEEWYVLSRDTKQRLKDNIRILSLYKVKGGKLKMRNPFNPKRLIGWQAASFYAYVTGNLFSWQTTAGDHES